MEVIPASLRNLLIFGGMGDSSEHQRHRRKRSLVSTAVSDLHLSSHGRAGVCDVPLYVPPNLYSNLAGQTLRGGDTTTNPPAPAGDLLRAGQR
jgi:hypothetical protein